MRNAAGSWPTVHGRGRWGGFWCVICGLTLGVAAAGAQDLSLSAQVDKTSMRVGEPFTLTVTLTGEFTGVQLPAFAFPEGLVAVGRSQSTRLTMHAGAMERSMSLSVTLVARRPGMFQLGPFTIQHRRQVLQTEPIEITVGAAAPRLKTPPGGRFTL